MRITHIAAEFAPIAKAGGLGEVLTGLCRQLAREFEEVDIILPRYRFIPDSSLPELTQEIPEFFCEEEGLAHKNTMWLAEVENCRLHLLEPHHPKDYFGRPHIYGYPDDISRFLYFSKAALGYLKLLGKPIDILHLHEWHSAIAAPLVKNDLAQGLHVRSVIFTIHNLEYQGQCGICDLDAIGLDGKHYLHPDRLQDDTYPDSINLLKGALVYSDAITTVSPSYAGEILTPAFGCKLDKTLAKYKKKLTGILNGIDQKLWDPETDKYLEAPFSQKDSMARLEEAKTANQRALIREFHLDSAKRPWVGAITRLVPQKSPDLLEEALHYTIQNGGVFLLLGSTTASSIQHHFEAIQRKYHNHPQLMMQLSYNEELAHRIYASLDLALVPSRFEPCGLTQLISMRYGALPIVRATGGLKDTVFDCEDYTIPARQRNGFTFHQLKEFPATLQRAFCLFHKDPATFQFLKKRATQCECSWKKPALQYLKLYRSCLGM